MVHRVWQVLLWIAIAEVTLLFYYHQSGKLFKKEVSEEDFGFQLRLSINARSQLVTEQPLALGSLDNSVVSGVINGQDGGRPRVRREGLPEDSADPSSAKELRQRQRRPEDNTPKPKIFFHVGPSKTATTTIQKDMVRLSTGDNILASDNYTYWGRYRGTVAYKKKRIRALSNLFQDKCMEQYRYYRSKRQHALRTGFEERNSSVPDCISGAREVLDLLKADNQSLIISDEAYSYTNYYSISIGPFRKARYFDDLREILEGWDFTVIIGYRRLFDWLLSCVKEFNAKIASYGRHSFMKWKHEGGRSLFQTWPIIREWMKNNFIKDTQLNATRTATYVYVDGSLTTWRNSGFDVKLLNVHSDRHISRQLLCDIVPDAVNACRHLDQDVDDAVHNSRSTSWFIYNQIMYTASTRGIIDERLQSNKTRIEMTDEFMHYHEKVLNRTIADLPLQCPRNEQLQRLLSVSLAKEKELMPDLFSSPDGEAKHRAAFQRTAYERREFCSIDLNRLFEPQPPSWEAFLSNLKDTSRHWPVTFDLIDVIRTYPVV